MELDEFITETLTQIIKGVRDTQQSAEIDGTDINPKITHTTVKEYDAAGDRLIHNIDFDVAVTAVDADKSKAKIGVVSGIFNAGAEGQKETTNSSVTRIKFSVPIRYPD